MKNLWLKISHSDYENHMSEVGQAQILNELTKINLDKYKPKSFALLGCSTGNGLEHIKRETTKNVYAIDINPNFLKLTKEKFENKIDNLKIYNIDIRKEELVFTNVDLFFIGLVFEYIEPEKALEKIIRTLNNNGILVIVIQKSKHTPFVSETKYKSLERLSEISKEIDEKKLDRFIQQKKMNLVERKETELNKNKSFISLTYKNRCTLSGR